ncbi:unnamed protein product, partial [Darwinula stevensoni]
EQNLIDCSRDHGNEGCKGGLIDAAFKYIKENGGVETEERYPYEGKEAECRYEYPAPVATVMGYQFVLPRGDEEALKKAVATIGPIAIAIDGSSKSFQLYRDGIYFDSECSSEVQTHALLLVGYDVDEKTGIEYWLVKNYWGTNWGDEGFAKIARNRDNHCSVASHAIYLLANSFIPT